MSSSSSRGGLPPRSSVVYAPGLKEYKPQGLYIYTQSYRRKDGTLTEHTRYYFADGMGKWSTVSEADGVAMMRSGTHTVYEKRLPPRVYGQQKHEYRLRRRDAEGNTVYDTDPHAIEARSRFRAYAPTTTLVPKNELAAVAKHHGVSVRVVNSIIRDADKLMYNELDEYEDRGATGPRLSKYGIPYKTKDRRASIAQASNASWEEAGYRRQKAAGRRDYRASSILGPGMA